jgi:cyclic pyranopterin phosphate synthase
VVRGLNDDELLDLAHLTIENPWHIRFIELMPVGNAQDWGAGFPAEGQRYISVREMKSKLADLEMQPDRVPVGNGPARTYRIPGTPGTVGFISPLGEHFCESCNRLRLTADGALRPCLLMDDEIQVRECLGNNQALKDQIVQAAALKPEGHQLFRKLYPEARRMAQIGG